MSKLSWSHYIQLLSIKNEDEIIYYINATMNNNLSKRESQEKISSHEYDRLNSETKFKIIESRELTAIDLVPNPIIIKFEKLEENITEYVLKQAILNSIDYFLKQLGSGFTYVGNEYKIKVNDRYNFIDILLYNIKYKCYVVIELKSTGLKKEHTGQIMAYMNYIDKNIRTAEENDTVGIIICKQDNEYVIKYCSDDRIIAREYELVAHNVRNI